MKLSERDRRTLRTLGDTLLPDGGPLPSARVVDVAASVESILRRLPAPQSARVVGLIRAFSVIPVGGRGRRFRNLSSAGRERAVARLAEQHGYRGQAFAALKQLLVTTWASDPRVTAAMGVDTGCLVDSPDHHQLVGPWLPEGL